MGNALSAVAFERGARFRHCHMFGFGFRFVIEGRVAKVSFLGLDDGFQDIANAESCVSVRQSINWWACLRSLIARSPSYGIAQAVHRYASLRSRTRWMVMVSLVSLKITR